MKDENDRTFHVSKELHEIVRQYCKLNGFSKKAWVEIILRDAIEKTEPGMKLDLRLIKVEGECRDLKNKIDYLMGIVKTYGESFVLPLRKKDQNIELDGE